MIEVMVSTLTDNISIDDSILIRQYRDGDIKAMERLIVKYQDRIYNAIIRICGNRDDAVELTQDTFVKVLEGIDGFEGKSSFYTWLFRVAVNLTINHCKRRIRISPATLDGDEPGGGRSVAVSGLKHMLSDDGSPDPARLAIDREMCGFVHAALAQLDSDHRAIVVLRDIEGMNYTDISDALGIEMGTVKSRLSRARGQLRGILEAMLK
ncbi:MAG TPA: sigma-70 family RNA polymerase sigma factor [Sedimentisphaerales bacterium]|nr:sigma-70 family RNA polymerase sigma factor [Sedimentisphaerales bacterium]